MTCTWPIDYIRCANSRDAAFLGQLDAAVKAQAEQVASTLLWSWTGKQFGLCPYTEVHAANESVGCVSFPRTVNFPDWTRPRHRGVIREQALKVKKPIHSITSVSVDGTALAPALYAFSGRQIHFQNYSPPSGSTITIEYVGGVPVPDAGILAASVLAIEIARNLCGDRNCQLPERVQSITRQGVNMEMMAFDNFADLKEGGTGLWLVDAWVSSVRNTTQTRMPLSPDFGR